MKPSSIAWPRLLAETAAIVLSILLALGVNEWREARRDRAGSISIEFALSLPLLLLVMTGVLEISRIF